MRGEKSFWKRTRFQTRISLDTDSVLLPKNQLVHVDLTPLAQCTQLVFLALSENLFTQLDLTPLTQGTRLETLTLGDMNVRLLIDKTQQSKKLSPALENLRIRMTWTESVRKDQINDRSGTSWVNHDKIRPKRRFVLRNAQQKNNYCAICKRPVLPEESLTTCPNCHNTFHEEHFAEWIKMKGQCPMCQEEIIIQQEWLIISYCFS